MTIADIPLALLAGGRATRLGPVAASEPKALLDVAGRPFIDHQLDLLRRGGIRSVVLCLGHLGGKVRAHLDARPRMGLEIDYSFDGDLPVGTGGALRRALPLLGELCFVLYGDAYLEIDYAAVLESFLARREAPLGLMTVLRNENRWDRSNVVFREGRLLRYDKRARTPDMTHIDYGVALLRGEAIERLPPGEPCDLPDLYRDLVADGRMAGYEVARRFYEIGSPEGLAETRAYLGRTRRTAGRA